MKNSIHHQNLKKKKLKPHLIFLHYMILFWAAFYMSSYSFIVCNVVLSQKKSYVEVL